MEPLEARLLFSDAKYLPTPPTTTDCPVPPIQANPNAGGMNPAGPTFTPEPVRYFDGQPLVTATDLSSDGFGMPWSQGRSFDPANTFYSTGKSANGNRWTDTASPHIVQVPSSTTVVVVSSGTSTRFYDLVSGSYVPRDFVQEQLTYDSSSNTYLLSDSSGGQTYFYGFGGTVPTLQQGQFKQHVDVAGNLTTTTYAASGDLAAPVGRLKTITRQNAGATQTEAWNYLYTSTSSTANLSSVQLLRNGSGTPVRQVVYSYYAGGTAGGNAGDLQSATVEDGSGNALSVDFYRYYTSTTNGYIGALKYVFSFDSESRATRTVSISPPAPTPMSRLTPTIILNTTR